MKNNINILIVEGDWRVAKMFEMLFQIGHKIPKSNIHQAGTYDKAESELKKQAFDLIILGHSIPPQNGHVTGRIGYGLIPDVKKYQPKAMLVGTSLFSKKELEEAGFEVPERLIHKLSAAKELGEIIQEILLHK